jgi:hypothetical protein
VHRSSQIEGIVKTAFVLIAWRGLLAIVPPEFVHAENVEAGIQAILKSEKGGAGASLETAW